MIVMIRGDRPARRGSSLIELLVVITVVAVLLGLCAVTIQVLLRVEADAQARRSASATLGRLADQFREDVHACDVAEVRPAAGLRLSRDRGVAITYQAREGRVERVEAVAGQASRYESYDLGRRRVGCLRAARRRAKPVPGAGRQPDQPRRKS